MAKKAVGKEEEEARGTGQQKRGVRGSQSVIG